MSRRGVKVFLAVTALLVLVPAAAFAQEGQIAGTVRDAQNAVMPGVTVEVTSPALIERIRTTTTDSNGQYRITNLPVGTYKVTFLLEGFTKHERDDIVVTSDFTAPVNATMSVGQVSETVTVLGMTPVVDVQNSREVINWPGEQIRNMPTSRNVNSLLQLTAGIGSQYTTSTSQSPFGAPGVCVGGIGVFCSPNVNGFNLGDTGTALDQTNLAQGRVLVDGQVVNAGGTVPIFGQTGGYVSDIGSAQEVNVKVSGALGESETGGSEINIVPRTGGNRYAGDFYLTYTTEQWFDTNNGNYPGVPAAFQPVKKDHDESIGFGGPIKRDRLWFFAVARNQFIHKLPVGVDFWPNLWEGVAGYNYQPDRDQPRVEYTNHWRNVNARVTWQATQKNKFNIFWDEQESCQDPCTGVVSVSTSPESWFSPTVQPNRVQQVTWTNPLTTKILLEAGLNVTNAALQHCVAPRVHQLHRHSACQRDWHHGGRGRHGSARESVCRRRLLPVDDGIDQQRDRRSRRDARAGQLPNACVPIVCVGRPSREIRLRRWPLQPGTDQRGQQPAADLELRRARRDGELQHPGRVWQRRPAIPERSKQSCAASGSQHD